MDDLEVDEEIEFRVAAVVESMGVGEFSAPTPPTRVRYPPCMPYILSYSKKTITVKAGEELQIPVSFRASPTPTVSWTNKGELYCDPSFSVAYLVISKFLDIRC